MNVVAPKITWVFIRVAASIALGAASFILSPTAKATDEAAASGGEATKASDKTEIVSSKMMFLYMELLTVGHTFPNDSVTTRLERLERIVFGKVQGGDPDQRLTCLMTKVSSGSSNSPGGAHHLIGGVSKSNLEEPGYDRMDLQTGTGSRNSVGPHFRANRALQVVFSLGGSQLENSFNGQSQMDALVSQYTKYVAGLLANQPVAEHMRVSLTMSGPGIAGGFSGGTVSARPASLVMATPAMAATQSSSSSGAYGRIATAGFSQSWSERGSGGQLLPGGDSSPDNSPVHFSPLIIQVSVGGSHVSNSFNSENQPTRFLEEAQAGTLPAVPSERPYALSTNIGNSFVLNSFDAPAGPTVNTGICAFVASKDFQPPNGSLPVQRQRPLVLTVSLGGSRFENCFNRTGGIVRLANEIADELESSVQPEILNNLSEIHVGKGGCKIADVYSTR